MNRDTLYSFAVVDLSAGATLTLPEAGERYLSVMVVNEDHYIDQVFHDAGQYELAVEESDVSTASSRTGHSSTRRTRTTRGLRPP